MIEVRLPDDSGGFLLPDDIRPKQVQAVRDLVAGQNAAGALRVLTPLPVPPSKLGAGDALWVRRNAIGVPMEICPLARGWMSSQADGSVRVILAGVGWFGVTTLSRRDLVVCEPDADTPYTVEAR